ncbi:MAG: nitroreductase family protein [Eubacteriales bacterium]|nr:nitroreductase family protein [Eubacteriales bacterium]
MEFSEVIKNRYSCKKFDGRKVERAQLTEILEAGRLAPTAKNTQEQHIYVAETEEVFAKLDKATPCRYNAGTVLVVAYDKNSAFVYPGGQRDSGAEDASIVATQMILAAANAGVDSCWVNFFDPAVVAKELGLPENEEVVMLMDLGYAAEGSKPLPNHDLRKPLEETVTFM